MAELHDNIITLPIDEPSGLLSIRDMGERPPLKTWYSGFPEWRKRIALAPRTLSVVSGHPGHGKALALDTPIPTPSGWTDMGNLSVGDIVFDEDGFMCRVIAATDVMRERECYAVKFDDGSEIVSDGDHRWLTESEAARQSDRSWRRRGYRTTLLPKGTDQSHLRKLPTVVTTREIADTLVISGKRNHAVILASPINCVPAALPVPPYTLGAWLGDGHSSAAVITCADVDAEIMAEVAAEGTPTIKHVRSNGIGAYALSSGRKSPKHQSLQHQLRQIGVLGNKHIPAPYLRGSLEQRTALLQGLMDTDGHVAKDRQAEYCTTNERLARDVYELVCSLGIRARIVNGRATLYGRDCGPKYRVMFSTARQVFRLRRKVEAQGTQPSRRKYRYVTSCERVESVPVRCIEVDSPSKLFLAGRSFIPTHNSSLFGNVWFNTVSNHDLGIVVATFENHPIPSYRKKLRQFWAGMPEHEMTDEQRRQADDFIHDHYRFVVHPQERPTIEWLLDWTAKAVDFSVLLIDPWNRIESQRGPKETETEYIAWCLTELRLFALEHNCHVQIIAHPAKRDAKFRDRVPFLEDISGSKNWDNMPDQGFVIHRERFWDAESNERQYDCQLFHLKAREEELGYQCCMKMRLNPQTQRFEMAT